MSVPNVTVAGMRSDNPTGAGDQQERPGIEQWIVGFVDGAERGGPVNDPGVLRLWQRPPGPEVRRPPRGPVRLQRLSVPRPPGPDRAVLERYPLVTAKADAFTRFAAVIRITEAELHLSVEGLARIAEIAQAMNHRKPSRFLGSSEAIRQPAPRRRGS